MTKEECVRGDDDACYTTARAATCANPLLPSVSRAIILTMEGSERAERGLTHLHTLCADTYVQINRGYRRCAKPAWVTHSGHDLVHANARALARAAADGVDGPVLVLEDDAVFDAGVTRADFAAVDAFVRRTDAYDVYTLGSFGLAVPLDARHRRFVLGSLKNAQAVVWSPEARARFLAAPHRSIPHIDSRYLATLHRAVRYHRPLVVQTFPPTVNRSNWCVLCPCHSPDVPGGSGGSGVPGAPSAMHTATRMAVQTADRALVDAGLAAYAALGLTTDVRGWTLAYALCDAASAALVVGAATAVVATALAAAS